MDGESVLAGAVAAFRAALGDRLLGAYALGSLAHGGFSALVSDVDLGLILSDPLRARDAATVAAVTAAEKGRGAPLQARLSVFWGTPSTLRGEQPGGRFPALDRLDLIRNGRLLAGEDAVRRALPWPSRGELVVTGTEFALDHLAGIRSAAGSPERVLGSISVAREDALDELRSPALLASRGVRRVTKLVLFPVRFLHTADTGEIATNDAAVDRYLAQPAAPATELVAAARTWRTGGPFDEAAAARLLEAELVALYVQYIDDHIERLGALDRGDLVAELAAWRGRLLDSTVSG